MRTGRLIVPYGGIAIVIMLSLTGTVSAQHQAASADPGLWEQVQGWYELAKQAGELVPADIYTWVKQDVQSIGDWEYKVLEITSPETDRLEEALNALGTERWECLWIQPIDKGTRVYLKRPVRSYLRHIPISDLLKLTSGGEGSGDSN